MRLLRINIFVFFLIIFSLSFSTLPANSQNRRSPSRAERQNKTQDSEHLPFNQTGEVDDEIDEDVDFEEIDYEDENDDEEIIFENEDAEETDTKSSTSDSLNTNISSNNDEEIRISLKLKNMDILEVFNILSQRGKINIIAGTNVRGRVTLFLDNVDVWDAFRIIMEINNLAYMKQDDIVKVMTEREYEILFGAKFYDKSIVKVYPVKHTKASILKPTAEALKSRVGKVLLEENTNSIIIIDAPNHVKKIISALEALDVPIETVVYSLKYSIPATIEEKLKPLLTSRGLIHSDTQTNKIIITDVASNMGIVHKIIDEVDNPPVVTTRVFPLQYAKHDVIGEKIEQMLTKDLGTMSLDERTNKVAITDTPDTIRRIGELIAEFDAQHKEVLIECQILQVTLSDEFKYGLNWEQILTELQNRNFNLNISSAFSQLTDNALPDTAPFDYRAGQHPGGRIIATGVLEGGKDGRGNPYQAILEIIRDTGNVDILSAPRITVVDNQTAEIQVGTNEAYVTSSETLNASTSTTSESVNFIRVGILLKVTPRINDNGFINMEIEPEVSSVKDYLTTASNNKIPIVRTSNAKTFLMVKDGVTIVLGGFIEKELREEVRKVPILGSIPIIGLLFKNVRKVTASAELVIFMTPHIITGDVNTTETEKINEKLLKSFQSERKENKIIKDLNDIIKS